MIPDTVIKISDFAFCNATFEELVIPSSVKEIGMDFLSGSDPQKIILPASLKDLVADKIDSYHEAWKERLVERFIITDV